MVIKKHITIELKEDEVKKIIAHYLTANDGFKVKPEDVTLQIGTKCIGYGMDEHSVTYFKGAIIKTEI